MKEIELTQGQVALVDDEDYERLSQWKLWCALKRGRTFYAGRSGTRKNGKRYVIHMHREILRLQPGDGEVDHINHNGLDNRRSNLRVVSHKINSRNRRKHKCNTSGYNGVVWEKKSKKWRARIDMDRKNIHLGLFNNIDDAVKARAKGELEYWT